MKLPNLAEAVVPSQKITDYLLNINHDEGYGKAQFFLSMGFEIEQWQLFAQRLIRHAQDYEVVKQEATRFGVRYVIEGTIEVPIGRIVNLRSVWFIADGDPTPRLVTAYPLSEQE